MGLWKLDPSHTDITFSAKHMMVTTVRGRFADISGELRADPSDLSTARGEIRIGIASLSTGTEYRDNHLRSVDFFDAEAYPAATFQIGQIEAHGDRYIVTGDLAIRGVTRPLTLQTEVLGFYTSMEGARRAGFSASATLRRKDWGLNWNVALESGGWLVGEDVRLTIDAAFEEAPVARADTESAAA